MEGRPSLLNVERVPCSYRRVSSGVNVPSPSIPITSNGFGSPHDTAHTPPGILTKFDSRIRPSTSKTQGVKFGCICCENKDSCICKKCTLEKLKFYSRKESIARKQRDKQDLAQEMEYLFGKFSQLQSDTNVARAEIILRKRQIEEKMEIIRLKEQNLKKGKRRMLDTTTFKNKLEEYLLKHKNKETSNIETFQRKQRKLDDAQRKLDDVRKKIALQIFQMFHIREVTAEMIDNDVPQNSRWALVNDPIEEGHLFQVRDAYISDSSVAELSRELQASTLNLLPKLRSSFAALLHTVQLVNLLTIVFDHRLPLQVCLSRTLLLKRTSAQPLNDVQAPDILSDWFKLRQSVLSLCLFVGIDGNQLRFDSPHSNLLELVGHLLNGNIMKPQPGLLNSVHQVQMMQAQKTLTTELSDWVMLDELS